MKTWLGVLLFVGFLGIILYSEFRDGTPGWLCADEDSQRWLPVILADSLCEETGQRAVQGQSPAPVTVQISRLTPAPTTEIASESPPPVPAPAFLTTRPTPVSNSVLAPSPTPAPTTSPTARPAAIPTVRSTSKPLPTPVAMRPSILAEFPNGSYLEHNSPDAAQAVKSLPWVQDSIAVSEERHLIDLIATAVFNRKVFKVLIETPWVRDGFSEDEGEAFKHVRVIAQASDEGAETVIRFPWVQDGLSEHDLLALDGLAGVAYRAPGSLARTLELEWLRAEISGPEAGAVQSFEMVGWHIPEALDAVLEFLWVQDDITDYEAEVVEHIASISFQDGHRAQELIAMPFLESLDAADGPALMSLLRLAAFEPGMFDQVLDHETLTGGITDKWAGIVATLYGVGQYNATLVGDLLKPGKATVEQRVITLPLRGEVLLAIIRTGPGASRSMDLLEAAVRSAEDFMGAPFPTGYVGLLFEHSVVPGQAGTNFGTHIAVLPEYDSDDGGHAANHAGHIIAHEVAHYYWRGNADWIDEGAADFMASVSENIRTGSPVTATNYPCAYADHISEFEGIKSLPGSLEHRCNYALGERLFLELYRGMGAETFQTPFRALYLESGEADIDSVRAAFRENVPPVAVGPSEQVISHWYDGSEPFGFQWKDESRVHGLDGLNGRLDEVYISLLPDGPKISSFLADEVNDIVLLGIEYSYNMPRGSRTVTLDVVVYYEDGFLSNQRDASFDASSSYIGGSLRVGIGPTKPHLWKSGSYQVYIYQDRGRKVGNCVLSNQIGGYNHLYVQEVEVNHDQRLSLKQIKDSALGDQQAAECPNIGTRPEMNVHTRPRRLVTRFTRRSAADITTAGPRNWEGGWRLKDTGPGLPRAGMPGSGSSSPSLIRS